MIKKVSIALLLNGIVFAESFSDEVKNVLAKNTYEPSYFAMILGLFLVVGLIYLTGFLYQKMIKVNLSSKDVYLNKAQIISTTSLGQGRNLHVVKIGDSACLLGATQHNITFIKSVELIKAEEKESKLNGKKC